jgi:hypothetical protein
MTLRRTYRWKCENGWRIIGIALFLLILLPACAEKDDCTTLSFGERRISEMARGELVSYVHHIQLNNYNHNCFSEYNFMRLIRHYLDTNTIWKPVRAVCFHSGGSGDWQRDRQTEVLCVYFTDSSLMSKMPTLSYIAIGPNNKYELDIMYMLP